MRFINVVFFFLLIACGNHHKNTEQLLNLKVEHKMISSGDNFPALNLKSEHREKLLLLSSEGISKNMLMTDEFKALSAAAKELEENGYLIQKNDLMYSTVLVMHDSVTHYWRSHFKAMVDETIALIEKNMAYIQGEYDRSSTLKTIPFENSALFILSNVLLDNWQINRVEEKFLNTERTSRHGKNYFYALHEKKNQTSRQDALGIYGNQMQSYTDFYLGLYGNERNGKNLLRAKSPELVEDFPSFGSNKKEIIETLFKRIRTNRLSQLDITKLKNYELEINEQTPLLILSKADQTLLTNLAAGFYDTYEKILLKYRSRVFDLYYQSPYKGVKYEEFYMWWYHIFYSEVTDVMIERGLIKKPQYGNTYYIQMK